MNIPHSFLSKMPPHEVEVHGVKVKVSVLIGDAVLIDQKVSEFRTSVKGKVMGLDVKMVNCYHPQMLLLCAEGRCLIIPRLSLSSPGCALGRLLSDKTICFVGMRVSNFSCYSTKYSVPGPDPIAKLRDIVLKAEVNLGHLAAMVLKKSCLQNKELHELGGEVGVDIKPLSEATPNLNAYVYSQQFFSEEEIKYAIHDVYGSYLVGNKLLGMLQ